MNCKNEHPFNKKYNNFSFNYKDVIGFQYLFIILVVIIALLLNNNNNYAIILCILLILVKRIHDYPIHLLYIPSSIISYFTRTPEFLDKDMYFPNNRIFEKPENFIILKKEVNNMLSLTNNGNTLGLTKNTYGGNNTAIGDNIIKNDNNIIRAWRILNIKAGDTYSSDAIRYFPHLVQLLNTMPEVVSCVISILEEGVKIPIHVGYYKGIMRYMIPIIVPKDRDNIFLCVNEIKYHWTEGNGVLWDDTYPHKVYNNTNEIRVVIYMDVKRPYEGIIKCFNDLIIDLAANSKVVKDEIKKTEIQVKINDS